eukprot:gene323-451_t
MDLPQLQPTTELGKDIGSISADRVLVAVRVRPMLARTDGGDNMRQVIKTDPRNRIVVTEEDRRRKEYPFDYVFSEGQEEVYDCIGKQMLREAFAGYNVCLFAYGQTGSGKTYTLQGLPGAGLPRDKPHSLENEGLTPRVCRDIFSIIQTKVEADPSLDIRVFLSITEVYNEKVRDLLPVTKTPKGQEPPTLKLVENPQTRKIEVKGLAKHRVIGYERLISLMQQGNANREVAETKMNECSSRSHQIAQLHIVQEYEKMDVSQDKRDCESYITLVDLAGSERQSKTGTSGEQFKESTHINLSLLTLGRCLNSFSEGKQRENVPLRDSQLTRLLSESFGGNSKTWMLAAVSPTAYNLTETVSTLNYASNAKNITNHAKQNRLARALELHELKQTNKGLQEAYDAEHEKQRKLALEIDRLTAENDRLRLNQSVRKQVEDLQSQAVQLKSARERKYQQQYDALSSSSSVPYALTTPRPDTYIGRAKISLRNIIEQVSNYHTLSLSNESNVSDGSHVVLVVNIYP